MPDIAPPTTSPSLTDLATRINSEFAAIQKADQDANKNVVQRAITFGRTWQVGEVAQRQLPRHLRPHCPAIHEAGG